MLSDISVGHTLRKRTLEAPAQVLAVNPDDRDALRRWRAGNIVSFAFAETVSLFGVLLRILGGPWKAVALFFAVGLLLLLLWTPRMPAAAQPAS